MQYFVRTFQRILIALVGLGAIWFIVTQIFERLDERMPAFFAAVCTYIIAAYFFLPFLIRSMTALLRQRHIPRFTTTVDGLIGEPVNLVLIGNETALQQAFSAIGWSVADPITPRSAWRTIVAIARNTAYAAAPFSARYLFARHHECGFQLPIGTSPHQRHHVRFWSVAHTPTHDLFDHHFWNRHHLTNPTQTVMWVGSANKDVGLAFARLTYKITHAVDKNIDEERDYILSSLRSAGWIAEEHYSEPGELVEGKYISDGRIRVARLTIPPEVSFK